MDKRKLSKIPRPCATQGMINDAKKLESMNHMVTAELIEDKKILLLNFFRIKSLAGGNTEAEFRTFLSHEDYITQDLKTSKTKWYTASFAGMWNFSFTDYLWDPKLNKSRYKVNVHIRSVEEEKIISNYFVEYARKDDEYLPWTAIYRFQQEVLDKRLKAKHKKETDKIDAVMDPIKDPPKEFEDWIWETGMSFSRYLIYKEEKKGEAVCECTHCKTIGTVKRKDSLIDIVGEDAMKREFPDQLLVRKKSDKILAKLMGECVECHKQQEKNQMVSITARTKRGGKTNAFAYMCKPCFVKWCREHGVKIPPLEGLEDK